MNTKTISETKLINDWNVEKNASLDPKTITTGSSKKVWWKCKKDHEWKATIGSRSSGVGCPYCSNKRINSENNLKVRFPEIAKEWDNEKNNLTADKVFPGTVKKYWWKCINGHSYQASPNKRTSNRGCPYCSNRLVSEKNSLVILYPSIAKEFHKAKNIGINVNDLSVKSHKKIWWKCKKRHEWQAIVSNRTRGDNCPFCNSQVSKNELRIYSELKYFFNSTKLKKKVSGFECDILIPNINVAIEYDGVYWHKNKTQLDKKKNYELSKSGVRLIRIRELGLPKISDLDIIYNHNKQSILVAIKQIIKILISRKWLSNNIEKQINNYLKRLNFINEEVYRELLGRLPSPFIDESLEYKFPSLAKEWNTERNKGLLASDVSSKSGLKVWWKCKNGHEWESSVSNRSQGGNNCPYCTHQKITIENSLAFKRPDLINEWHLEKNNGIKPIEIFAYTNKKYWWKCKYGHEWLARPANRASFGKGKNTGCPFCSNKKINSENSLEQTNKKLAGEWNFKKNDTLKPNMVTQGSEKKVWWKCSKNHEWEATITSRNRGNGCPHCNNRRATEKNCLQNNFPEVAKEWNQKKNGYLTSRDISKRSSKLVWWVCENRHEWAAKVKDRVAGRNKCPECKRKKLYN